MTPDTRTVVITADYLRLQVAIPWCPTHNCQVLYGDKCPPGMNIEQYAPVGFYKAWCEVSTGGPDHKWWKDT